MKKFNEALFRALCVFCGFLLLSMMCIMFAQVIARYVFENSLSWSEEVGRYLFVWIVFLGTATATEGSMHVCLDLLSKSLKGVSKRNLELLQHIFAIALSSTILYSGYKLFLLGMRQTSPALSLPMHYIYIVIPVSGALMLYFSLCALWLTYKGNERG